MIGARQWNHASSMSRRLLRGGYSKVARNSCWRISSSGWNVHIKSTYATTVRTKWHAWHEFCRRTEALQALPTSNMSGLKNEAWESRDADHHFSRVIRMKQWWNLSMETFVLVYHAFNGPGPEVTNLHKTHRYLHNHHPWTSCKRLLSLPMGTSC
jgi:hypothetical protein